MVVLAHDGAGRLELAGRYELDTTTNPQNMNNLAIPSDDIGPTPIIDPPETSAAGTYKYHKRLRVLPRRNVRQVKVRLSYDE